MKQKYKFLIVGTGNVAFHLSNALHLSGHSIAAVVGRTIESCQQIAHETGAKPFDKFPEDISSYDIILLSISDDAYKAMINSIPNIGNKLILHTSGSVDIDVFENKFQNFGVFYPLQRIQKNQDCNYSKIPFLVEANCSKNTKIVEDIAKSISDNVSIIDSKQRLFIHLAAVLTSNFTNFLYTLSAEILEKNNIDFSVLYPLINETVAKMKEATPQNAQTGPAIRNDRNIIDKHLSIIDDEKTKELYSLISSMIHKKYSKK